SALGPVSDYAKSKLQAEEVCRSLRKDGLVMLRSANILGWGQAPKAVVPVFFNKALNNEPLDIIVPAATPMQFVAVQDVVDAFEAVLARPGAQGCFNIASPQIVTVEQLARKIIGLTGSSSVLNAKDRRDVVVSPVVCRKAGQELGWRARTGL